MKKTVEYDDFVIKADIKIDIIGFDGRIGIYKKNGTYLTSAINQYLSLTDAKRLLSGNRDEAISALEKMRKNLRQMIEDVNKILE